MENNLELKIKESLSKVMHPAINLDLVTLGIIKDFKIQGDTITIFLKFPFLNIPIKDELEHRIKDALKQFNLEINFDISEMSEEEKQEFFEKEQKHWR